MTTPHVSVVIPSYNSAQYLGAAVESVLAQTFTDLEVLVIDDGSTDGTGSLMQRYATRVRCVAQPNRGVAAARNEGISRSAGHYVAFLDADDHWMPGKLQTQIEDLKRNPEVRACHTAFQVVRADAKPTSVTRSRERLSKLEALLTRGNVVGTPSTVLCERSLLQKAGGFDPDLSQCADWDLWVRMATLSDFLYVDEPLVQYRQHASNMSRDVSLLERDSVRVLEKGFAMENLPGHLRALRRKAFARNYMVLAGSYFGVKCYRETLRCATRAFMLDPRQLGYVAALPWRAAARFSSGPR